MMMIKIYVILLLLRDFFRTVYRRYNHPHSRVKHHHPSPEEEEVEEEEDDEEETEDDDDGGDDDDEAEEEEDKRTSGPVNAHLRTGICNLS